MVSKTKESGLILVLAASIVLLGCATRTAPATQAAPAILGAPAYESWSIVLTGARSDTLSQAYYQKLKAAGNPYLSKMVDKKGVPTTYSGLALSSILAMVDGPDSSHPFGFDQGRWDKGYEITLTASDGYSATFSTKDIAPGALILADTEAGLALERPIVVGDGPKNLWIKELASISTSLDRSRVVSEAAFFTLDLDLNGMKTSIALADLEKDPAYREGKGSYTTSAGTRYSNMYGGISLSALLGRYINLKPEDSVSFLATDGYEMTYPGSLILDEAGGTWLLAFKMDGDYLPKNPGFIRTIKVGPEDPNIDGHLSVKMIKTVVVKQKGFKDFSLSYSGKKSGAVDRSTLQSCVSCHSKEVAFERKETKASYRGFPLHLLLAYADDPYYAPHKQDSKILAFDSNAAAKGYAVELVAQDGYSIRLDSRDLLGNDEIILAMYREGDALGADEFPLVLVWDKAAARIPEGIKNVKQVSAMRLIF